MMPEDCSALEIAHIVATDRNRVIGLNGTMPWPKLSADLKRFKELTMGHPVIMGRKTWESLPKKKLPGRQNLVISRHVFEAGDGVEFFKNVGEAITTAKQYDSKQIFIIGGGEIYKQTLSYVNVIYLTEIDAAFEGDTFYPEIPKEFRLVAKLTTVDNNIGTTFKLLVKTEPWYEKLIKTVMASNLFQAASFFPKLDLSS